MNIGSLIDHYVKVKSMHNGLSSSLDEKLIHIRRVFGDIDASSSGQELVIKARLSWGNLSPGTLKRYLVQLKAILRRAELDGLIAKAPHVDLPYVYDVIDVDVSASQVNALLDYLKWTEPRWYPLVLLLVSTGARLGEALSIDPESDFTRHGVRVRKPVNRKSKTIDRHVPYTARLRREIDSGLYKTRSLVPAGVAPDSVAACLGRVISPASEALGMKRLRVHDLRHAFAAVLAENGADLADLMSALGHSNISMSMRYRGLVATKLTDIMSRI